MITLVLKDQSTGEELTTQVEGMEEIVAFSIGSAVETEETIVYAFESNVELFREQGDQTLEYMSNVAYDLYALYILKNKQAIQDFNDRIGLYENV